MIERVLQFGDAQSLTGILTVPEVTRDTATPAVILLNAGIIPHIGPHRLNVKLARLFAEHGFNALRFDLSGLGDSRPSREARGFGAQAVHDIRKALDLVTSESGCRQALLIGICSGADNAYNASLIDPRITGLALLDPYAYPNPEARLRHLLRQAGSLSNWIGRLRGVGAVALSWRQKVARIRASRERGETSGWIGLNSGRTQPPLAEFGAGLAGLSDRGVRILMIFTRSARGRVETPGQFYRQFHAHRLLGRVQVAIDQDANHTFTAIDAQHRLIRRLIGWAEQQFHARE